MKKIILGISSLLLLLAVAAGGFGFYITRTPEYALKKVIQDVNNLGVEGLDSHLTGKAKETLSAVSSIADSSLLNAVIGLIDQDDYNDYIEVLKSKMQEMQWQVDDVLQSEKNASVILSFSYDDKLAGTIELSMVKEDGEWKIDGLGFPEFSEINW